MLQTNGGHTRTELVQMASSYEKATSIPDYGERVKLKAELGRRMGEIILRNRLDKKELLREHLSEGMLLALAYAVQLRPMGGDADILLRISDQASQLHTRYVILTAFETLARNRLLLPDQLKAATQVLDGFSKNADQSLKVKIADTRRRLTLLEEKPFG